MSDPVNHPDHYGGEDNPYEIIKIIEALKLGFNLGNCFKYFARAGKKDPEKEIEDLDKSIWCLTRHRDMRKREIDAAKSISEKLPEIIDDARRKLNARKNSSPVTQ